MGKAPDSEAVELLFPDDDEEEEVPDAEAVEAAAATLAPVDVDVPLAARSTSGLALTMDDNAITAPMKEAENRMVE